MTLVYETQLTQARGLHEFIIWRDIFKLGSVSLDGANWSSICNGGIHLCRNYFDMKFSSILILVLTSTTAGAGGFELSLGQTYYGRSENGTWYQNPMPYSYDQRSTSIAVGYGFDLSDRTGLHVGYTDLGTIESHATASASDHNYTEWLHGQSELWPVSKWNGKGSVRGIYALYRYDLTEHLFLKVGGWVSRTTWEMNIPDWRCATDAEGICTHDYPGATYSAPRRMRVVNSAKYRPDLIGGLGIKIGRITMEYTARVVHGGDWTAINSGLAHNVSIVLSYR